MIKLLINGIEVFCDDPEQVMELTRLAGREKPHLHGDSAGKPVPKTVPVRPRNGTKDDLAKTLALLRVIQSGTSVDTPTIVKTLGLGGNRGVGGVVAKAGRFLEAQGFERKQVFLRKGVRGNRQWKAASRIGEAIRKLEEMRGPQAAGGT